MQKRTISLTLTTLIAAIALHAGGVWAQESGPLGSPVGLWKNIDDRTGKIRSLIRITDVNGELQGKIEKIYTEPAEDPNPKCTLCEDARKNQPIIGMTFMNGLRKNGDEYTGGEILDPNNGKVYKSKMELIEGGKKLKVRGYIGAPLFGRSQVWLRSE